MNIVTFFITNTQTPLIEQPIKSSLNNVTEFAKTAAVFGVTFSDQRFVQAEADEKSPYVFVDEKRLKHILIRRDQGTWKPTGDLINNVLPRLKKFCRLADVTEFTLQDLRRSCITNWARSLPIQVVQQLAGHSKIETTRKYYLSVQQSDLSLAREIQSNLMTSLTNF